MPYRQLSDAGAQSTVTGAITNSQTTITLVSATGFPAIVGGGQLSVTMLDSGNPAWNASAPLATPYEYQQVNTIAGNVLTFGPGGGAAARSSFAGTTPKAFFAGATVAATLLAEDIVASAPWTYDEQTPTAVTSITIPASGSIPASYLGVNFRQIRIEWTVRTTSGNNNDNLAMQLNGDSGANYSYQLRDTAGASVTTGLNTGQTSVLTGTVAGGALGAVFSNVGWVDIFLYANTTWAKKGWASNVRDDVSAFGMREAAWEWRPTVQAAITSITLALSAGNFAAGSTITTRLLP
jgi:hypothetical protein